MRASRASADRRTHPTVAADELEPLLFSGAATFFGASPAMQSFRACKRVATLLAATAFLAAPSHPQAPKLCDQPLDASIADMFERVRRLPGAIVEPSANGHFDVIRLEARDSSGTSRRPAIRPILPWPAAGSWGSRVS